MNGSLKDEKGHFMHTMWISCQTCETINVIHSSLEQGMVHVNCLSTLILLGLHPLDFLGLHPYVKSCGASGVLYSHGGCWQCHFFLLNHWGVLKEETYVKEPWPQWMLSILSSLMTNTSCGCFHHSTFSLTHDPVRSFTQITNWPLYFDHQ